MPRLRKTVRGEHNLFKYENAYEDLEKGLSLRIAAKRHGLCHMSLSRYKQKRKKASEENSTAVSTMGYAAHNKVFTDSQEKILSNYLLRSCDIYFGLSSREIRKLAFEMAVVYNLERPSKWDENKSAGIYWFKSFMLRNPELSVRTAQGESLSRATSFNRINVDAFYDNLKSIMDRHDFEAKNIYNFDELGVTTIQKQDRVVARRGSEQIGSITSEKGTLVTLAFTVNAVGNVLPPMFVFPRVRFRDHFIKDAPLGSVGVANTSGWMQDDNFLEFLKHFQKHTHASKENKVLLVLDNHSSHIHINCLEYSKENGIVLLSFPPHCSHKLEPLESSCFGPLKKAINSSCDAWLRNNPGKTMKIQNIPSIIATSMPQAFTSGNIRDGFQKTGIFPMNRNIFTDLDFAPSFVTYRQNPNNDNLENNDNNRQDMGNIANGLEIIIENKQPEIVEPEAEI
ncbi:uncharacterized protein LOC122502578 [Leptopilina heterotoma]|uniref:uncharacterized protein LOC122502578 n=1 Tax=Leptopilina heterotoma TaxID=63436 RepID=UPI001CA858E3|nr:uncharacterized protein LOC122502578 [Leptopilina heterotoma]